MRCSGRVDSSRRALEAEQVVQVQSRSCRQPHHLLLDLLLGAEDVGVVLGEVPHAQQPVQHAAGLVAVQQTGLGVAHRQVAVGVPVVVVELDVRPGSSSA